MIFMGLINNSLINYNKKTKNKKQFKLIIKKLTGNQLTINKQL